MPPGDPTAPEGRSESGILQDLFEHRCPRLRNNDEETQSAMRRLPGEFNGRARVRDENGEEGAGGVV